MADRVRAGIIGAGFMGKVHARAVRMAGGVVQRVTASTPQHSPAAAARLGAEAAAATAEELVTSPDVDVVHVCTPNAYHAGQVRAALAAGKHVICEKPLALDAADAASLADQARDARVRAAVPFVYRYYPSVREAKARIAARDAGELRLLHGSYLQDWLSSANETNWRVDPDLGGRSRAFADIGVHWCDLMEFTTGHRITRLTARTITVFPDRPTAGGQARRSAVQTEDAVSVLFDTDHGATGSVVISQVSLGRKNRLWFSFDGTKAAYSFDQELPDRLWIGNRDKNWILHRGVDGVSAEARLYSQLPPGHPQGYHDCFAAFIGEFYAAVLKEAEPDIPTFDDGTRAATVTDAVIRSAALGTWVEVPA